jgi:hypothetical protein
MRMRRLWLWVLSTCATFSVLPTVAARGDVEVNYTVNDKALKAAVAGTSLAFQLYSDSSCTMAVGSPVSVNIENVYLIERLKRFTPKGGTKAPATDRLTAVLSGATGSSPTFLKVTGTGISSVGGDCQLQFATNGGTNLPCASQVGSEVYFTGCNVNVRSGSGSTEAPPNGLGNLVVGYNESGFCFLTPAPCNTDADCPGSVCETVATKSGSHNLVVGPDNTYTNSGGFVVGTFNTVSGLVASVSGGSSNVASGDGSSVSGGTSVTESGVNGWSAGAVGPLSGPFRFFSH